MTVQKTTVNLREVANQIIPETKRIVKEIREDIKKNHKIIQSSAAQRKIALEGFNSFLDKIFEFEEFYGKGYLVSQEYFVFLDARLSLETRTKSVFACFRCGCVVATSKLVKIEHDLKHLCHDGEYGNGDRTSWFYLYATFVRNEKLKEAIAILDKIMKEK